jgi:hypothetical protein
VNDWCSGEVGLKAAENCKVGENYYRTTRSLDLEDDRLKAVDNVLVGLATREAVVQISQKILVEVVGILSELQLRPLHVFTKPEIYLV